MPDRTTDLLARLENYAPHDEEEAQYLRRMLALARDPGGDSPFSRLRFEPGHFTASAFIVSPEGDALLLLLHAKLGRWLQPGGHVEPGDASIFEAAQREVREEVGLVGLTPLSSGIFDLDVHAIPTLRDEPGHGHFDVRFAFRATDRSFTPCAESRAGRWVPWAELDAAEADSSVTRAAAKLRSQACVSRS